LYVLIILKIYFEIFILRTNNKEYHLRAENHEALMIWLLGLQVRKYS